MPVLIVVSVYRNDIVSIIYQSIHILQPIEEQRVPALLAGGQQGVYVVAASRHGRRVCDEGEV